MRRLRSSSMCASARRRRCVDAWRVRGLRGGCTDFGVRSRTRRGRVGGLLEAGHGCSAKSMHVQQKARLPSDETVVRDNESTTWRWSSLRSCSAHEARISSATSL